MQAREAATKHADPTARARVAVLGASGYTGEEVVRLMALHPSFTVAALTGESQAGKVRISTLPSAPPAVRAAP
jgi:N-acetyl-gamma-glutamyl-phosphate reductase